MSSWTQKLTSARTSPHSRMSRLPPRPGPRAHRSAPALPRGGGGGHVHVCVRRHHLWGPAPPAVSPCARPWAFLRRPAGALVLKRRPTHKGLSAPSPCPGAGRTSTSANGAEASSRSDGYPPPIVTTSGVPCAPAAASTRAFRAASPARDSAMRPRRSEASGSTPACAPQRRTGSYARCSGGCARACGGCARCSGPRGGCGTWKKARSGRAEAKRWGSHCPRGPVSAPPPRAPARARLRGISPDPPRLLGSVPRAACPLQRDAC